MMKKIVFLLSLACAGVDAMGQIAQWKIYPEYDAMTVPDGTHIIQTVSESDGQTCLWSFDGQKLAQTGNTIYPFRDGYAVCENNGLFHCFYSAQGDSLGFVGGNFRVEYPYVSYGLLLVRDLETSLFRFINVKGIPSNGSFVKAFPFLNGYASCIRYNNPEKQKDPYPCLISMNCKAVDFSLKEGKTVPEGNIDFISSVNEEGIAVVIIKKKIYLYDTAVDKLTPLGPTEGFTNMKDQAHLVADLQQALQQHENDPNHTWLVAVCGKNNPIQIRFDEMMMPLRIHYIDEQIKEYKRTNEEIKQIETPLQVISENGRYGLSQNGVELLPPQFDEVRCLGNRAIVSLNGKYGLLEIHKDDKFTIWLNDKENKDISFLHQTVKTKIGVDFPLYIPADRTRLDIDSQYGCKLDKMTEEVRSTRYGNSVTYDCVLQIPDLDSDNSADITYPIRVYYDGLISPGINYEVKTKYQSWFVVNILDSERYLENGNYSFSFDVSDQFNESSNVRELNVEIYTNPADSLYANADLISGRRYKCDVRNLHDGINNIVIRVQESGCPVIPFPYEIVYTKPVAAKRGKAAQKEEANIKKQTALPDIKM